MSVMRGEDGAEELRRRAQTSKVATRVLSQPLRSLGVGVTGIVLGVTAMFGGLEDAEVQVPRVAALRAGETVHAAPYDITVRKVVWVDELPNVYPAGKGNRWLAVTATVVNTHDESLLGAVELRDAVALSGVDGLVEKPEKQLDDEPGSTPRVESSYRKVLADTTDLDPVSPGMPYEMVFLFEQAKDSAPPSEVTIQVVGHTWRENSLDSSMGWFDPTVVARATLPMVESEQQVKEKAAKADRDKDDKGDKGDKGDKKKGKPKRTQAPDAPDDPDTTAGGDA